MISISRRIRAILELMTNPWGTSATPETNFFAIRPHANVEEATEDCQRTKKNELATDSIGTNFLGVQSAEWLTCFV